MNTVKLGMMMTAAIFAANSNALTMKFGAASDQKIADVALSDKAILEEGGKTIELTRVAAGLRYKKVAFIKVNVYNTQFFAASGTVLDKKSGEAAIDSLLKNKPAALALTFHRDVQAKQMVDAFKESLEANGIKPIEEPYHQFLADAVKQGEAKSGQTVWLVMNSVTTSTPAVVKPGKAPTVAATPAAMQDILTFYADGKSSFSGSAAPEAQFLKNFLKIWFGKPADAGLEHLKEQLLK